MKAPVSPWFHLGLAQVLSLKFARVPQLIFIHFQHPKIGFRLFEPCPKKCLGAGADGHCAYLPIMFACGRSNCGLREYLDDRAVVKICAVLDLCKGRTAD